jgi:hypothetical protein
MTDTRPRKDTWLGRITLDHHVRSTLLLRLWTVLAGLTTLLMLSLFMDKVRLGYHYAFASLLGLQIFFELGMNQIVLQISAHEVAHLRTTDDGRLEGEQRRIQRLVSLAQALQKWYRHGAVVFFALVGAAGIFFFVPHADLSPKAWLGPWLLIVAATAVTLYLSPWLALLEGAGSIGQVATLRLYQSVVGFMLTWLALAAGLGLWASPLLVLVSAAGTALWLRRRAPLVQWLKRATLPADGAKIDWKREVVSYQVKLAISWISGYFIYQLFVPLVFHHQGAAQAGRLGITLAVFNAIQAIGMSWIYGRSPAMSACISRGERAELRKIFWQASKPAIFFTALFCAVFVVCLVCLHSLYPAFAERVSSIPVVLCMCGVTIINSIVFAAAVFMRAHKEEPLAMQAATLAVLVLMTAYFGARISVEFTMQLYLAITALVSLPWALILFKRYYQIEDATVFPKVNG